MIQHRIHVAGLVALAGVGLLACGADTSGDSGAANGVQATIAPSSIQLAPGGVAAFASTVAGTTNLSVTWSVVETAGGSVDASGRYTAPQATGTFHVRAQSVADPTVAATAVVLVTTAPPPPSPPVAPTNAVSSSATSTSISVSWTDNASDEDGYLVERSASASAGFAQVGTTAANATSYTDGGLTVATTYYYRVRATNAAGNSAWSNVASATTQGTTPPPTNVAAALAVLASKAVFFDHASVGMNIMAGVERLLTSAAGAHPTRVDLGQGSINPAQLVNGAWMDHYFIADNGYPLQKMQEFRNADLGGTGLGTKLNTLNGIAFMKLCFADFDSPGLTSAAAVDSAFATFQSTMSALQADYPNVKFVYLTAALRSGGNGLRERYNQHVRDTYGGTGRVFDLANVESNGATDGSGRIVSPAYNDGSDHLNSAGQDAVARALVLFLAGL